MSLESVNFQLQALFVLNSNIGGLSDCLTLGNAWWLTGHAMQIGRGSQEGCKGVGPRAVVQGLQMEI